MQACSGQNCAVTALNASAAQHTCVLVREPICAALATKQRRQRRAAGPNPKGAAPRPAFDDIDLARAARQNVHVAPAAAALSDRGAIFLAQSPSQLSTARDFGPAAQYATSKSTTRL